MVAFIKKIILLFSAISFLLIFRTSLAYVASSTNYRIDTDTISIGGALATSTSYIEQNSLTLIGGGNSTSTSYGERLGYLQTVFSISMSSSASVSLSPNINLSGGGQSNGTGSVTVTTDDPSGYTLSVNSGTSPAFSSSSDSFSDYSTKISGVPDFIWNVGAAATGFGFSPEGSDIYSTYMDDGTSCGTGSLDTPNSCWDSITTTSKTIAKSSSANVPSGSTTNIKFRAEAGRLIQKKAGNYNATIIFTALAL